MKKVIPTERSPIKLWLNDIEEGALDQAKNIANLPFIHSHVAIMSDSHQGYGPPIGSVFGAEDVIIPNAIGKDIGCGMIAVRTSLTEINQDTLKKIMGSIRNKIPVGFKHHSQKHDVSLMPDISGFHEDYVVFRQFSSARKQLSSLGGGNHFIELQKGDDGYIWIMIHSGSRNIGKQVADYYDKVAVELNKKWHTSVPKEYQMAFLPLDSDEGLKYADEMNYCVKFAVESRKLMMESVEDSIQEVIGDTSFDDPIHVSHNYASSENHFGKNIIMHRKGATSAFKGQLGIIPGSQGSKSYIVRGKGNRESFCSCSHGAGRCMSRKKAQKELDLEEEQNKLDELGVLHSIRNKKNLDEASSAYKDISVVMENQKDLVDIEVELTPLAVIKG